MIASPLRYPGGKAKLFPFVSKLIQKNELYQSDYCEPFAGGAGLAIKLLSCGYVNRIRINDIDSALTEFWNAVFFEPERLCRRISDVCMSMDEWYRQKAILADYGGAEPLDRGFAFFFLNRTNRSGIVEGAGPIGGYAQSGPWKIDVRFVKDKQIKNIMELSKFSAQVQVSNLDALEFLEALSNTRKNFIYLDPPYYIKGKKLYKNFYNHEDHLAIAAAMARRRDGYWIVSYDDVPPIRSMYSEFSSMDYTLNYSAAVKTFGREVLFASDPVSMPHS